MMNPLDPVVERDLHGTEHAFLLTASALRRVVRRMEAVRKTGDGADALGVESVFITAWEARVDKSEADEETFFDRFDVATLRRIVERLQTEHQPEGKPEGNAPAEPAAGSASGQPG